MSTIVVRYNLRQPDLATFRTAHLTSGHYAHQTRYHARRRKLSRRAAANHDLLARAAQSTVSGADRQLFVELQQQKLGSSTRHEADCLQDSVLDEWWARILDW